MNRILVLLFLSFFCIHAVPAEDVVAAAELKFDDAVELAKKELVAVLKSEIKRLTRAGDMSTVKILQQKLVAFGKANNVNTATDESKESKEFGLFEIGVIPHQSDLEKSDGLTISSINNGRLIYSDSMPVFENLPELMRGLKFTPQVTNWPSAILCRAVEAGYLYIILPTGRDGFEAMDLPDKTDWVFLKPVDKSAAVAIYRKLMKKGESIKLTTPSAYSPMLAAKSMKLNEKLAKEMGQ